MVVMYFAQIILVIQREVVFVFIPKNHWQKIISNITIVAKCLVCEAMLQNKKGSIAVAYRLSSQITSDFDHIVSSFDKLVNDINI